MKTIAISTEALNDIVIFDESFANVSGGGLSDVVSGIGQGVNNLVDFADSLLLSNDESADALSGVLSSVKHVVDELF